MRGMDAAADDELRELWARAYGPRADIAGDPSAVRRLEELESSRSAASTGGAAGSQAAGAASVVASVADSERAELRVVHPSADASRESGDLLDRLHDESTWDESVAPAASHEVTGWPGHLARWRAPLWVASVAASAALAASIAYAFAVVPPVSSSAGAPQIETLELTRSGMIAPGWFGAEKDAASAEFSGLTVFLTPGWYADSGERSSENVCLNVVRNDQLPDVRDFTETSWSFEGQRYAACGVGAFPPTVAVPFDSETPDELAERFPSGVALQFVLDGGRVGVFLDSGEE